MCSNCKYSKITHNREDDVLICNLKQHHKHIDTKEIDGTVYKTMVAPIVDKDFKCDHYKLGEKYEMD